MDRKHENIAKSRTHRQSREDKNRHLILIHLKFTLFAFHPSPPVYQRKYRNTEPRKAVPTDQQPTLTAPPSSKPQEENRERAEMEKKNAKTERTQVHSMVHLHYSTPVARSSSSPSMVSG